MAVSYDVLLDTAHKLANAAGKITLRYFRASISADDKGGREFDPVTVADRGAEEAMRDIIMREFPTHGIAGEEFGTINEGADYVWTLDPIDGTRSFIMGLPLWGTLIGLQHLGRPILGIMDQPFIGERFWSGERDAWYRGPKGIARCKTRACSDLSQAYLAATTPDMFRGEDELRFNRLAKAVRMRRFGGDCYAYSMLAIGHIDIVAEACLKPFDIVPLIPIVEKAGGIVTGWEEGAAPSGGRYLACGDPSLRSAALACLTRNTGLD
jgi:histidinol phosphatase-like enzyme (inositol monophosphatase family)